MSSVAKSPVLELYDDGVTALSVCHGMHIASGGAALADGLDALVDVSALPRHLIVGAGAPAWLRSHAWQPPSTLFECHQQSDGHTLVRLHDAQYLLLAAVDAASDPLADVAAMELPADVLILPYECAEFAVLGPARFDTLLELSRLDPAVLAPGHWCATQLAHADVGMRVIDQPQSHWRIVCSPADARYLFSTLRELLRERGGLITTQDAYRIYAGTPRALSA